MISMQFGTKTLSSDCPAFIMGIVNATPDSFYTESRGGIELAEKLIEDGADILDIGGESTRPGFKSISDEEEIKRILPVIKEIRKHHDIPISIDTTKFSVLKAAFDAGADIFNDISCLEQKNDYSAKKTAEFISKNNLSVILTHRFLQPENTRKTNPEIVKEVSDYLEKKVKFCMENKILENKIIIDPGIGFGKTFEENVALIKNADKLCNGKYPVLMALSRKRCIGTMTGREVTERMAGTLSADILSVIKGAIILRVHDVKETKDSLNVMKYLY